MEEEAANIVLPQQQAFLVAAQKKKMYGIIHSQQEQQEKLFVLKQLPTLCFSPMIARSLKVFYLRMPDLYINIKT